MPTPLVTIITVCKNARDLLEITINSVLSQSYNNIEYIIIDGNSSDGTQQIVSKYLQKINFICEPDNGLYFAMNKGIKLATGQLIGLINAGDWYESSAIEEVVQIYEKLRPDVINGHLAIYNLNEPIDFVVKPNDPYKNFYNFSFLHPTCFIQKKVYDKFGYYDEKFRLCADKELFMRLTQGKVKYYTIPKVIAHMSMGGLSDEHAWEAMGEAIQINRFYGQKVLPLFWTMTRRVISILNRKVFKSKIRFKS